MSFVGSPARALNASFNVPGEGQYHKRQGFALIGQSGQPAAPTGSYGTHSVISSSATSPSATSLLPPEDIRSSSGRLQSEAPAHNVTDGGGPLGLLHPTRMSIFTQQVAPAMIQRLAPSGSQFNPNSQATVQQIETTADPDERAAAQAARTSTIAPPASTSTLTGTLSGTLSGPLLKRVGSYFGTKLIGSVDPAPRPGSVEVTKPPKAASIMDPAVLERLEPENGASFLGGTYSILCYNYGEMLCFNELSARSPEPSYSVLFKSPPCSHSLSAANETSGNVRLLVGCVSGEVFSATDLPLAEILLRGGVGFSFANSSQTHNVEGQLSSSRIVMTEWIPGTTSRFVVVHMEGVIAVYDTKFKSSSRGKVETDTSTGPSVASTINSASEGGTFQVGKKQVGVSSSADVTVWRQMKGKKSNPVTVFRLPMSGINAAALCPSPGESAGNPLLLAIAGRDGYVRIVDMTNETLLVSFQSYCGGFLCVSWSPDGRYIATGGEDDLVSIFCPADCRAVVRCEGHSSWVSSVWWDEAMCKNGRYRLGSAGQDTKLLLWDFEKDALQLRNSQRVVKSRAETQAVSTSTAAKGLRLPRAFRSSISEGTGANHSRSSSADGPQPLTVPAAGRAEIPILEPTVCHFAHNEPLTDVKFGPEGVITSCAMGLVKLWGRPQATKVPPLELNSDVTDG